MKKVILSLIILATPSIIKKTKPLFGQRYFSIFYRTGGPVKNTHLSPARSPFFFLNIKKSHCLNICFIILMILSLFSCEKELDKTPIIGELESNFYKDEGDAINALNAAYDPLQYNYTTSVYHFRWFYGDFASDDAIKGGSGVTDQPQLEDISQLRATPSNIHLNATWTAKYVGIYRTNLVLENVPNIEADKIDEGVRQRILAEAKFLRAYYYFELVTMFGGVPLVDKILSPSEYNQPRATAAEIWNFIETDLTEAIAVLPFRSEYAAETDLGRATKGAANALLAKTYLYQSKWMEAETAASEVINSGQYSLNENYADIFLKSGENGPGSIFEIQRSPLGGGYWGDVNGANEGNLANVYQLPRGQFGGWGFNIPTQDFVDEFEEGDPRLIATVFQEGETMGDRGVFIKSATGFDHDYYPKKFFVSRSEHEEINTGDPSMNGESNDRIIRYSDLLLMYAEAAFHNGNEGAALDAVNQVRARARRGESPFILPDVVAGGQQLLEAIWHERRVELGLEGSRFFDLVRQGNAAEKLGPLGFQTGKNELWPIPQQQIDLSNGVLTQNIGY